MSDLTIWGWQKKKRTMLRYIKPGDIFCFKYDENTYCFGRIISRLDIATIAEIFDFVSSSPNISKDDVDNTSRMFHPINLDIYTLFDRKIVGEWRIIGRQENFIPEDVDKLFFTTGYLNPKKIDIYGNEVSISNEEAQKLQDLTFRDDGHIKNRVREHVPFSPTMREA